ncbi:MAG: hypothetical protein ABJB66_18630 [Gemmatimonadaceae bacterium]
MRGAIVYVLLRIVIAVFVFKATKINSNEPVTLTNTNSLLLQLGVVGFLVVVNYVNTDRRHEQMLWANLGYSNWVTMAVLMIPAVIGEIAFGLMTS